MQAIVSAIVSTDSFVTGLYTNPEIITVTFLQTAAHSVLYKISLGKVRHINSSADKVKHVILFIICCFSDKAQGQDSLLVKRRNDNHSPATGK